MNVSVVIPTHNRAATIGDAIRSVLNQTVPPSEVIVVDDGSNDHTSSIVRSFCEPSVRLIRLENSVGAQAARNTGIRAAQYPWIAFNDSDDLWYERKLELQMAALSAQNTTRPTVVYGAYERWYPDTDSRYPVQIPGVQGNILAELLKAPSPAFPTLLAPANILFMIGLLDEKVPSYQEWDTALLLSTQCDFLYIDTPLMLWRQHQGPAISKSKVRDIKGYHYVVRKWKDRMDETVFRRHVIYNAERAIRWELFDLAQELLEELPRRGFLRSYLLHHALRRRQLSIPYRLYSKVAKYFPRN